MPIIHLPERAVVGISGPDARHFLQTLVTTDVEAIADGEMRPGALLSPQGKILFDFLVCHDGEDGFLLDVPAGAAADLMRRLMLYKLRAKVKIGVLDQWLVHVGWDLESLPSDTDSRMFVDRRFPPQAMVRRIHATTALGPDAPGEWTLLRIAHGVAESGDDFALGDAFPHDVLLDQSGGIGFTKGCYVGQEVVSRMQHRGTARRRVMIVEGVERLPGPGGEIRAGGRAIGVLGSVSGRQGLAIVRIDRVREAIDAGAPITAGEVAVDLVIPAWARFTLPTGVTGEAG